MTDPTPPDENSPSQPSPAPPATRRELMAGRRPDRHWALIVLGVCALTILGLVLAFLRPGAMDEASAPEGRTAQDADGQAAAKGPGGDCAHPVPVAVAATPEIRPVVEKAASRLTSTCATFHVATQSPDATLATFGDRATRPHLWISDSSVQLMRAQSRFPDLQLTGGAAFATSPIVAAVPRSAAKAGTLEWSQVFARPDQVHLADPMTSSTGLMALMSADPTPAVPNSTSAPTAASTAGPMGLAIAQAGEQKTAEPTALPGRRQNTTGTYLVSEQQFVRHTADHPASTLVAVAPKTGSVPLDYRAVPLPTTNPQIAEAVRSLADTLRTPETQGEVRATGFRVPGDAEGPQVRTPGGDARLTTTTMPVPDAATIRTTITQWQSIASGMRLLAIIDTSGSMRHGDTGNGNRIELAAKAAAGGAMALPPNTDLGLWEFSTGHGPRRWRELAPVTRLVKGTNAAHRDRVLAAAQSLPGRVGGDTPLYDTILAGVQRLHEGYDPKRIQAVIVMTDGRNDVRGGLDLTSLLTSLKLQNVPGREVSVGAIAIGPDADKAALKKIADATGGGYFFAEKPEDIGQIVVSALMNFTPTAKDTDPLP